MVSKTESSRKIGLTDIFNRHNGYPFAFEMSSYLTVADALVLSRVCKAFGDFKDYMLAKVSDINTRLQPFVKDPVIFRSQLAKHDGLISGMFALDLFEVTRWEVPYLDIFIKTGPNAEEFSSYLQREEAYLTSSSGDGNVNGFFHEFVLVF